MHKIMLFWCLCCCCSCSCYSSLFWSEGAQCHDKWKNPKCAKLCIYSETTGYYEKCSCFVKRCFLQTQCKCNETFIIEWIKTYEKLWIFCHLKTQWGLFDDFQLESLLHLEHYLWLKVFCSFLFLPFKLSQECAFRRVHSVHNPSIKVNSCQLKFYVIFLEWDFNRSINR